MFLVFKFLIQAFFSFFYLSEGDREEIYGRKKVEGGRKMRYSLL
jgi:hypothetical protein